METTPGTIVSFYETEPGVMGISEAGPANSARMLGSQAVSALTPVELYRKLAGGAEPPAALVDAETRAAAGGISLPPGVVSAPSDVPPSANSSDGVAVTSRALTGADGEWFRDNGCFTGGESHGCFPNWSNGGFADYNTRTSFFTLAPYAGDVFVRFRYEGSTRFTDPVFEGEWLSWWFHSAKSEECCGIGCWCGYIRDWYVRNHRWDIIEAAGKSFHWSTAARWNCSYTNCNGWPI